MWLKLKRYNFSVDDFLLIKDNTYFLDEYEEKVCWYTQGESTIARNIMPCFDEPKFKVSYM